MKVLHAILLISIFCFEMVLSQSTSTSGSLSRKVLTTLQPEESIIQDESCFPLGLTGDLFYMVTMLDGKYFIYENGQRKGPFEDLSKAGYKPCEDKLADNACNAFKPERQEYDPELLAMSDDGQQLIQFKGKTYGPYTYFKEILVSADKSEFVAIAMNADMKSYLVTSGGLITLLEGEAESIHLSPSGKNYVFVVKENPGQNIAILSMDFSKMSTEEVMKFAREQEEKAKQAGPPKAWVYTKNGPKLGPYKLELQGLFTLYVQYGTKYSNFSVGRFQMKPSFARQVESDIKRLGGNLAKTSGPIDTTDAPEARLSRVKRLESPEWQLQYLIWFIKIMDQRYGEIYKEETLDKLKFYATAYNCGYASATKVIRQNMLKNTFHTAIFGSKVRYNYGDIAGDYYSSKR